MKPVRVPRHKKYSWEDLDTKGWFFWPEYSYDQQRRFHSAAKGRGIVISARKAELDGVIGTLVELRKGEGS